MDWKLQVIVVPVADVDRAIEFYRDKMGFSLDMHMSISEDVAQAQLTPPGSGCSIVVSRGMTSMEPGIIKGLQLVVTDIQAARQQVVDAGVDVSPVRRFEDGGWREGPGGMWNSFFFFDDPDGNSWAVQEGPSDG